ncbi:MAG: hypothetical protein C5B51_14895 [Terriglobia bacterium]|nr:MAG: hypothetical protein C5B51_14895 [Terriglobia bacterium]
MLDRSRGGAAEWNLQNPTVHRIFQAFAVQPHRLALSNDPYSKMHAHCLKITTSPLPHLFQA